MLDGACEREVVRGGVCDHDRRDLCRSACEDHENLGVEEVHGGLGDGGQACPRRYRRIQGVVAVEMVGDVLPHQIHLLSRQE